MIDHARKKTNPYTIAPASAFWSRSVAANFNASDLLTEGAPLLGRGDKVMSAGSCFAANLVPYLVHAGYTYLRTEDPHPTFTAYAVESLSYGKFSAAYGNIYTARQLKQLLQRCLGHFHPIESAWTCGDEIVDPFRPGMRFKARCREEFEILTAQHLFCALEAFRRADVLIYTLGLTEAWVSRLDGAVFPACPGTVAGEFDPDSHAFHNFSASETGRDLDEFIILLRSINPKVRVILTVSPVPLVATATTKHVLSATIYSKSALRVAAHETTMRHAGVRYFPSYEIVTGPQAPREFFEANRRDVSDAGIQAVMEAFFAGCEMAGANAMPVDVFAPVQIAAAQSSTSALASDLIKAECEEAYADRR